MPGKSNREIASEMFISEGRVKNIVSCVLRNPDGDTQLAVFAIRNDIDYSNYRKRGLSIKTSPLTF